MFVYSSGSAVVAYNLMKRYDLAAALLTITLTIAALNIFEADLTDRFYYVPAAILVALLYSDRLQREAGESPPATVDLAKAHT